MFDSYLDAMRIRECRDVALNEKGLFRFPCGLVADAGMGRGEVVLQPLEVEPSTLSLWYALALRNAHIHHHAWGHPDRDTYDLVGRIDQNGYLDIMCECKFEEFLASGNRS